MSDEVIDKLEIEILKDGTMRMTTIGKNLGLMLTLKEDEVDKFIYAVNESIKSSLKCAAIVRKHESDYNDTNREQKNILKKR